MRPRRRCTPLVSIRGLAYHYAGARAAGAGGCGPGHPAGLQLRPARAQWRGQDHAAVAAHRPAAAATGRNPHRRPATRAREPARVRALTGLVPQDLAFYPQLTGRENLRFFADVHGLSAQQWPQRLEYCVAVCRLDEVLDQRRALLRRSEAALEPGHRPAACAAAAVPGRAHRGHRRALAPGDRARPSRRCANRARRWCTPRTTWRRSRPSATRWPSSTMAMWWRAAPPPNWCADTDPAQPGMSRLERAYLRLLEEAQAMRR